MKFFEDIAIGESVEVGSHTFTVQEIGAFTECYDPLPFYLDETTAHAKAGRRCASGWHIACVWMRLLIDHRRREDEARRARGEPVAMLGVSPGFHDLQWPRPVYPDDTIAYSQEVIDKRASLSRRQWGIVTTRNTGINQNGDPVLLFVSSAFVERKPTP